jgi:hypothetical protein
VGSAARMTVVRGMAPCSVVKPFGRNVLARPSDTSTNHTARRHPGKMCWKSCRMCYDIPFPPPAVVCSRKGSKSVVRRP